MKGIRFLVPWPLEAWYPGATLSSVVGMISYSRQQQQCTTLNHIGYETLSLTTGVWIFTAVVNCVALVQ